MTEKLARFVAQELSAKVRTEIRAVGDAVRARLNGVAVLFYGSALRTGELDGVLDFYVLTEEASGSAVASRWYALALARRQFP